MISGDCTVNWGITVEPSADYVGCMCVCLGLVRHDISLDAHSFDMGTGLNEFVL